MSTSDGAVFHDKEPEQEPVHASEHFASGNCAGQHTLLSMGPAKISIEALIDPTMSFNTDVSIDNRAEQTNHLSMSSKRAVLQDRFSNNDSVSSLSAKSFTLPQEVMVTCPRLASITDFSQENVLEDCMEDTNNTRMRVNNSMIHQRKSILLDTVVPTKWTDTDSTVAFPNTVDGYASSNPFNNTSTRGLKRATNSSPSSLNKSFHTVEYEDDDEGDKKKRRIASITILDIDDEVASISKASTIDPDEEDSCTEVSLTL